MRHRVGNSPLQEGIRERPWMEPANLRIQISYRFAGSKGALSPYLFPSILCVSQYSALDVA